MSLRSTENEIVLADQTENEVASESKVKIEFNSDDIEKDFELEVVDLESTNKSNNNMLMPGLDLKLNVNHLPGTDEAYRPETQASEGGIAGDERYAARSYDTGSSMMLEKDLNIVSLDSGGKQNNRRKKSIDIKDNTDKTKFKNGEVDEVNISVRCTRSRTKSLGNNMATNSTHVSKHPLWWWCCKCEKSFFTPSQLLIHEKFHTEKKPYKCSECKKRFITSGKLKVHEGTHRKESYKCRYCSKTYTRKYYHRIHERRHEELA